MSDADWINKVKQETDPKELLKLVCEHFTMIPTDPYYRDLTNVLLAQIESVAYKE